MKKSPNLLTGFPKELHMALNKLFVQLSLLASIGAIVMVCLKLLFVLDAQQQTSRFANLPSLPQNDVLIDHIREEFSELGAHTLSLIFRPERIERSGLLGFFALQSQSLGSHNYRVAVVRHDIACGTCKDLLVAVILEEKSPIIKGIVPIEPWELENGLHDPRPFFKHFVSRSLMDSLTVGVNGIDGVSGATYSVEALLKELNRLAKAKML